jgi:hypothetical protein
VTRRWTVRLVAGIVAATAVLSGCSEKQPARETLPSQTAAETTPELPPLGPEDFPVPDEARTQDAAGVEAFVRYYVGLINRASKTLDSEPLRALSDGCDGCDRIATNYETNAQAGNRYEGGEVTITEVAPPSVEEETAQMIIRIDQTPLTIRDASGNRVEAGSSDAFVGVPTSTGTSWDPALDSWVMTNMAFG